MSNSFNGTFCIDLFTMDLSSAETASRVLTPEVKNVIVDIISGGLSGRSDTLTIAAMWPGYRMVASPLLIISYKSVECVISNTRHRMVSDKAYLIKEMLYEQIMLHKPPSEIRYRPEHVNCRSWPTKVHDESLYFTSANVLAAGRPTTFKPDLHTQPDYFTSPLIKRPLASEYPNSKYQYAGLRLYRHDRGSRDLAGTPGNVISTGMIRSGNWKNPVPFVINIGDAVTPRVFDTCAVPGIWLDGLTVTFTGQLRGVFGTAYTHDDAQSGRRVTYDLAEIIADATTIPLWNGPLEPYWEQCVFAGASAWRWRCVGLVSK